MWRILLSVVVFGLVACGEDPAPVQSCDGAGTICTFVGNGVAGLGSDGMQPTAVSLYLPQDLTFGPDGLPYILDWNNHRVRTVEGGVVRTVIGTGYLGDAPSGLATEISLNHPTHISFDPLGNMILSAWHNSKILRMDMDTRQIGPICGTGARDYGGDGGPAISAILDLPVATAFDDAGRLLLMDQANQRVRRVDEQEVITTVVGPAPDYVPDGFTRVCDSSTGTEVCKLCTNGTASDPACAPQKPKPQGYSGDGGPAAGSLMYLPFSQSAPPAGRMEMGPDGTLYFADSGNHRVRAVTSDGNIDTIAGSGPATFDTTFRGGYAGDGGPATGALLRRPVDVAVAPDGTLFIADTDNDCIRQVSPGGTITTVAGVCGSRGYGGDFGPATAAQLNRPYGVALDAAGNLYIADTHNNRIRVVRR
jgi:hypothetical protein